MLNSKLSIVALLALTAPYATAFTPANLAPMARSTTRVQGLSMAEPDTASDVSIVYDSAARLAYDTWREQFGKGDFDPVRFESFKNNYNTITVANVKNKKEARESGTDAPELLTLNEFGDYTAEEFEAAQSGASTEEPTKEPSNVLGEAFEAAQQQSSASSALSEAADALAEEELVSIFRAWRQNVIIEGIMRLSLCRIRCRRRRHRRRRFVYSLSCS